MDRQYQIQLESIDTGKKVTTVTEASNLTYRLGSLVKMFANDYTRPIIEANIKVSIIEVTQDK